MRSPGSYTLSLLIYHLLLNDTLTPVLYLFANADEETAEVVKTEPPFPISPDEKDY